MKTVKTMETTKRLERIVIKGLFNRFNYDIDLNNGERVAILSAPNGCGKTTIFNIVDFMFMPTFEKFRKVSTYPFDECACYLSNGKTVVLTSEKRTPTDREKLLVARKNPIPAGMGLGNILARGWSLRVYANGAREESINISGAVQKMIDVLRRGVAYETELIDAHPEVYEEMNYRARFMIQQNYYFTEMIRKELAKCDCDLSVYFIQADRLHNNSSTTNRNIEAHFRSEKQQGNLDPLSEACNEIKEKYYLELRDKYHTLQSEASESLPKKYLQAKINRVSLDEFKRKWNAYIDDIKKFYEIGLLDSDETILSEDELDRAYEEKKAFLNVYLKTFDKTLEPLRKEYDRMKLFTDILNRRNKGTFKEMKYGRDGIEILVEGEPLNINCLSSGEKHDFIMFYNLIFKTKKGSMVFIDEPEISLHINWQEEYVDRLLEICRINDLQAFIATHSPNIINDHFDLMVERGTYNGG